MVKTARQKIILVALILLTAVALLTGCGPEKKESRSLGKSPVKKSKKQPKTVPAVDAEQQKVSNELTQTGTEMNAALQEIDSLLKEIDTIDGAEDQVPKL